MNTTSPRNIMEDYESNMSLVEYINNSTDEVNYTAILEPQRDSLFIVIPITIIYSIIFITGLLGNIFTCIVIIRNKSMHTATNYYLFSLAISDLLLLISGMPQEMYSIWYKWPYIFGHSFCVIRGLAAETSTNASVLTITLFTVERYLAICHPFVSHKMSKLSRAIKHVILLWVVALALALPQALQFGTIKQRGVTMCLQTRVIIQHSFEISTFFVFFAPMVLITVLYSLIGLKLRETNVNKEQSQKDFERSERSRPKIRRKPSQSTRRVVKMLVAVVVAFFICWAPFHAQRLVAIWGTIDNHEAKSPILLSVYYLLTYVSGVFYYISTCINPIFYHIMSNKFREAFKNTMSQWCCRSRKEASGKRCSYTAIAFPRNRTSSGTAYSGNSLKNLTRNDSSNLRNKMRRQDSSEKTAPTMQICQNGNSFTSTPVREYRNKSSIEYQQVPKEDLKIVPKNNYIEKHKPCCPVSHPTTTETIIISPDIIPSKEKIYLINDEPEKYVKENELKIAQRTSPVVQEYG